MAAIVIIYQCVKGHIWCGSPESISEDCPICGSKWDYGRKVEVPIPALTK